MDTDTKSYLDCRTDTVTVHDAITATVAIADCKAVRCSGATNIMLELTGSSAISNRSCAFTFYVSMDGTNFYQHNVLIDNATAKTVIASKTIATATTALVFVDLDALGFNFFKILPTITDSGTGAGTLTAKANITY